VNDDLWQAPLTEEEEVALIAQEAADNEAAELEEFRQARIRADAFDEAEELRQRQQEYEAVREAAFLQEQQEQEQIEDSLLYPLQLAEVELELEYAEAHDPHPYCRQRLVGFRRLSLRPCYTRPTSRRTSVLLPKSRK